MITRRQLIAAAGSAALLDSGCRARPRANASLFDYIPASQHDLIARRRSTADVTDFIQRGIDECASAKIDLVIPSGTYRVSPRQPLAHADPGFRCLSALLLRSSMRLRAQSGATFIMAPGVSSDRETRAMSMFGTSDILEDVEIDGLGMDMNGAANPISVQRRDKIYVRFPQAHIFVSGGAGKRAARIDRCRITRCRMARSPGVSCIVSGQSNAADAVLGRGWLIAGNHFVDNGLDTDDHSSIFGLSDDMTIQGNVFETATPYDGTGGNTAHEVHGARHVFDRNVIRNYLRGIWVSSSYSSDTTDTKVTNNRFETLFYGVDFFRDSAKLRKITNTVITNNQFFLDDRPFPGLDLKAAVQIASPYTQSGVTMRANTVTKTGDKIASAFLVVAEGQNGPGTHDLIEASDNDGAGLTFGIFARSSRTSGLGRLTFLDNRWKNLTPAGIFGIAAGCAVERTLVSQPVQSLTVGGGTSSGAGKDVSALFINTTIRSLSLRPVTVTGMRQTLVRGGASRIDTLTGSISARPR